jgi:hypothetical protein
MNNWIVRVKGFQPAPSGELIEHTNEVIYEACGSAEAIACAIEHFEDDRFAAKLRLEERPLVTEIHCILAPQIKKPVNR